MENNSFNHLNLALASKRLSKRLKKMREKQAAYKEIKQKKRGVFSTLFHWLKDRNRIDIHNNSYRRDIWDG